MLSRGALDVLKALFEKRLRVTSRRRRLSPQVLGRHEGCAARLAFREVSRRHARIRAAGARAFLEDVSSCNGTFINGMRVEEPTEIEVGDRISIGPAGLRVLKG